MDLFPTSLRTEPIATLLLHTNLQVARQRERRLIEDAGEGALAAHERGPKRLSAAVSAYLDAKRMRCSPRTIELEEERLVLVQRHFGDASLSALTAKAIADFQRSRHEAASRTAPSTGTTH